MKTLLVLAITSLPSIAFADAKPLPASQHTPPIKFDEASVSIELNGQSDAGYNFHSHMELNGLTSKTDRVRLDWKSGGKIVASAKCNIGMEDGYAAGSCDYRDKAIKATGAITAELIYSDDQSDKDYLVRTFKLTVVHLKGQWESWQIVPDDTLASAWMYMGHDDDNNSTYRRPTLYVTFATGENLNDGVLRCTAEGKKIPDIALSSQSGSDTEDIELDHQPKKGARQTYHWNRMKLLAEVLWGKRDTLKYDMKDKHPKDGVLSDNPGKWECNLRHDGKVIRVIKFVVNQDGMIQQDEMQTGKNAIPSVTDRVVLVEVQLTKDSATFDKRINPAAMKKSMGFGLPWPDHPKVKAIHATYPPKSGLPDPK